MVVNPSLNSLLISLWQHLGRRRQVQFVLLTGLMLISAIAEVVSLGAVLPFLGVLVSPDKIFTYPLMGYLGHILDVDSPREMVLPLTIGFAIISLFAAIIRLMFLWASTRLALACGSDISIEVYRRTLYQPFSTHVSRNSSEIIAGILSKVHFVVYGVLIPTLTLTSSAILLIAITITLTIINPMVAATIVLGFGSCYALMAWIFRRKLSINSQRIAVEKNKSVQALQEGLGGIRDVLLDGLQPVYCEIYRKADLPLRKAEGENAFIGQSPRYVMEGFGLVLIAFLAYFLNQRSQSTSTALSVIGVFALGAQRLLPSLQQGYAAWASIVGSQASLADTIRLLDQGIVYEKTHAVIEPLIFEDKINFNNVRFKYKHDGPWILDGVSFSIRKGMRVGIVGSTGSGKSTLLDLFMGLLENNEGRISVDGKSIKGLELLSWQKLVAHVPQTIYLTDASLAENIAFGIPKEKIDWQRIQTVAKQAQISEFIESTVEGYEAKVGERGVQLSGGQRQRIGIARALYKQATVLIFDEATSALDNITERAFMQAIFDIDEKVTILFVAHRLSTVRNCDLIIEMANGKIKAKGTYEELIKSSQSFRKMVEITKE